MRARPRSHRRLDPRPRQRGRLPLAWARKSRERMRFGERRPQRPTHSESDDRIVVAVRGRRSNRPCLGTTTMMIGRRVGTWVWCAADEAVRGRRRKKPMPCVSLLASQVEIDETMELVFRPACRSGRPRASPCFQRQAKRIVDRRHEDAAGWRDGRGRLPFLVSRLRAARREAGGGCPFGKSAGLVWFFGAARSMNLYVASAAGRQAWLRGDGVGGWSAVPVRSPPVIADRRPRSSL